tara:strand:- start:584 stop:787 length:204 start_codon:yes stop_codon:yes gene_type:complete
MNFTKIFIGQFSKINQIILSKATPQLYLGRWKIKHHEKDWVNHLNYNPDPGYINIYKSNNTFSKVDV